MVASSPKRVRVGEVADAVRYSVADDVVSTVSGAAVMNEEDEESVGTGNAATPIDACRLNAGMPADNCRLIGGG